MESVFLNAEEVAMILTVSKSKAYRLIAAWNKELQQAGKLTISGKINRRFLEKKLEV